MQFHRCRGSRSGVLVALTVAILLASSIPAYAGLANIHRDKLPQTEPILSALDDAQQLESYVDHWSPNWDYPLSKQTAAERLGKDLGFLEAAEKEHPDNEELLLLTALVAHYAYNVDVKSSDQTFMQSMADAAKLDPSDFRTEWFRADFFCQTLQPDRGANAFLALEAGRRWQDLPAGFWDNYLACAMLTQMLAHALRAADHLAELNAAPNNMRSIRITAAKNAFVPVDSSKTYAADQAGYATNTGSDLEITSAACGLRFRVHENWIPERFEISKGTCVIILAVGPYQAPRGPLAPNILILVRKSDGQETLADFLHLFTKNGTFNSTEALHCPASACLAMNGIQPGRYGKDGDSLPRVVAFERDQPTYPGLLFETPEKPPSDPKVEGPQRFRPTQTLQRMPGKLYYLITLDTASSIEPQAVTDFDFFLQHVQVE
jgi:hypothetical protein